MEPYIDLFLTRMLPVGIAFIITLKTNQLLRQAGYRLARRYKLFLGWTGWMLMLVTFYVLGTIFWGKADVLPWAISGVCCT
ncbi:MAG: hypothetical protein V1695_00510, partial [Candidatus Uhrbacteria bacterium]